MSEIGIGVEWGRGMSEIAIRVIREEDSLALSQLFPHWGMERCKKRIKKTLSSPSNQRFVAELDGNVVGHICVKYGHMHHAHIATLYSLMVEPLQRKKHIGTKLVEHTIKNLLEKTEIVLLQVQHDNIAAQKLFKIHGFEKYGYLPRAFKRKGEYRDNILMEKRI